MPRLTPGLPVRTSSRRAGANEPPGKRQKGTPASTGQEGRSAYNNGSSRRRGDENASSKSSGKGVRGGEKVEAPSPRPTTWSPRATPFQGLLGLRLSFNYWTSHEPSHQVLTTDVRKLVMATLAGEPTPDFAEKIPEVGKVVIACVTGLGMTAAGAYMTAEACPFLRSCSSVPVRHSLEPNRGGFPRALDVQPSAALMLWDEKPTISRQEIAAMSLFKLFSECEVTFAGIKSPGWKDDVSFRPSNHPDPSASECRPHSPHGDASGVSSERGSINETEDGSGEAQEGCRGSFWRNLNHDRGCFTLGVEKDEETVTWVLRLHWDRWDTEVVYLKDGGGLLRFEDKDQSLSFRFSCAQRLSDQNNQAAQQQTLVTSTSASSSSLPSREGTATDSPTFPSSLPDAGTSGSAKASGCAPTAAAPKPQSDGSFDGQAPETRGKGAAAEAEGEIIVEIKTPAESPVVIPLESLDPEDYCLKAVDCYRLNIPVRVSAEGPGYVSTAEPMSPPRRRRGKNYRGDFAVRRENGDGGSASCEDSENTTLERLGGRKASDDMELDKKSDLDALSSVRQVDDDHEDDNYEEQEKEDGEADEEKGAIVVRVVPTDGSSPQREENATTEATGPECSDEGGGDGSRGVKTLREGPEEEEEEEGAIVAAAGSAVESRHASVTRRDDDALEVIDANPDEDEEGEIVIPTPQRSSSRRPSQPSKFPRPLSQSQLQSPSLGSRAMGEGKSSGLKCSAPPRPFVPPSADLLCPILSGPRKGTVLLGLDCEMVDTKEGMGLARATLVNVKGQVVYDELVRPTKKVTDFKTQFSGITSEMLKGVTRTLRDTQYEILTFVGADTYLVGHSLESDLHALKIVHRRLIDTSELYPSSRGAPFKNGLRVLSQTLLGREIQGGDDGHDSREDAFASLQLALLKIHRGPSFGLPPVWAARINPPKESLFEELQRRGLGPMSCIVCGDLEAKASAEHPAHTPVWSMFNSGYRREQDAVWAAKRFRENSIPSDEGKASSGGTYAKTAANVTVDAAHFPTAGGMFRDALESLRERKPSLLWLDLPCDCNDFDQGGEEVASALWAAERRGEAGEENADHGPSDDRHWKSLVEVDGAIARVYDTMAEGTLLVVVCQGAVSRMVDLLSRKKKWRWNAEKLEKQDYIAGQKRTYGQMVNFDRQDEEDLAHATSDCLDGMCFLAVK